MAGLIFPKWNPQRRTRGVLDYGTIFPSVKRKVYKALRNTSSGFINRADVRQFIFDRDGHKCKICASEQDLTIDHIVSNLQTLCNSCNSGKIP